MSATQPQFEAGLTNFPGLHALFGAARKYKKTIPQYNGLARRRELPSKRVSQFDFFFFGGLSMDIRMMPHLHLRKGGLPQRQGTSMNHP